MLSYDDALARILGALAGPLPAEEVAAEAARGRALAEDVFAGADLPPFANSAVDGFAVRAGDTAAASPDKPITLRVTQTIPAGHFPARPVGAGEAARIFTGAPLPEGADGLVMVEDTAPEGAERIRIHAPGSAGYVRPAGSDIPAGQRAVAAGTTVDAAAVGVLSALNRTTVPCARPPRVAILTTGDEIIPPGPAPLAPGQIRDANGPALAAAAAEAGAMIALRQHVRDDAGAIRDALAACAGSDVILASGGVSVGDYDYVREVVEQAGKLDFWRIAIKPGKPLAFGQVQDAWFFGLPGNPVSSLVTFELFVRPVLRRLAGHESVVRPVVSAILAAPLPHEPGRREFARARLAWREGSYQATPTGAQGSHRLLSLLGADALLIAREERGDYAVGERLSAMLLTE